MGPLLRAELHLAALVTQERAFLAALRRLQDWHIDSVKAQAFSGRTSSSKPGARILYSQSYPGLAQWAGRWRYARTEGQRAEILAELDAEYYALGHSSSRKFVAGDELYPGTPARKRAIAREEGTTRFVARKWGVSKSTVARYRKELA